ncbi:NPCBM/NEW2 domain-containing protein [Actinoplanes subtropicus]|uniref:NPCBM/NEW2 domain-containing protein n=1 Tax=Actinoplanes subtropicus TaxID=543632 RepID=UPI0004C2F8A6|nr:NPCBM/NEW2 domain-containing protein [Actinoplanes subtropicus]
MNRSTRGAAFVLICLLTALIGAVVLYLLYSGSRDPGVALLAGCALVAFAFSVLAIRVVLSYRRSRRLELEHNVPPSRALRALELRQWLILTLGIAFVAVATGAGTALRVVNEVSTTATPRALPAATQPTTEPATTEPTTDPTTDPTTADPTDTASSDPTADPTDTPADTPATKYLDAEQPVEGGYDADSVTFAAARHSRGVLFWCATHDESKLTWNVAGYQTFTAVAGIDDQTENAIGATVEFLFYDQDGRKLLPKPAEVSVGHAEKISIDLKNVVSLRLTCAGRNTKTGDRRDTHAALGDPIVVQ